MCSVALRLHSCCPFLEGCRKRGSALHDDGYYPVTCIAKYPHICLSEEAQMCVALPFGCTFAALFFAKDAAREGSLYTMSGIIP